MELTDLKRWFMTRSMNEISQHVIKTLLKGIEKKGWFDFSKSWGTVQFCTPRFYPSDLSADLNFKSMIFLPLPGEFPWHLGSGTLKNVAFWA
jgi:hypothetical protein